MMSFFTRWLLPMIGLTALVQVSCTAKKQENSPVVNLAIWGNYLPEDVQKKFTEATGIQLNISNYSSNEELLAKIQLGASGIDVAVPSDYMVRIMMKLDLLEPLKKDQIKSSDKVIAELLNRDFDPGNLYSMPFSWTTTGIAVNRDLYKGEIKSWKDFFENPNLKGKISLLDDARESLAAVQKLQGQSVNTTNPDALKQVKEYLISKKKQIKMFTSDTVEILKNKEIVAAQSYSCDALLAKKLTHGNIDFIIPDEGSTMAIDNLVIFKNSKNKENAHRLINYFLQAELNKTLVENKLIGPVMADTLSLLNKDLQKDQALFPPSEVKAKLEAIRDLGTENKVFEEIWMQVKSQ